MIEWLFQNHEQIRSLGLGFGAVLGAFGFIVSIWTSASAARSADAAVKQAGIANDGKITDRLTKAVEHLASENIGVRIGALLSLERLAIDSARDHRLIYEQISAFLRENTSQKHRDLFIVRNNGEVNLYDSERRDIQIAFDVLIRRDHSMDGNIPIDLSECLFVGLKITDSKFKNMSLLKSKFIGCEFTGLEISFSTFLKCEFRDVKFLGCIFCDSRFFESTFSISHIGKSKMIRLNVSNSNFERSKIVDLSLISCSFRKTKINSSSFSDNKIEECTLNDVLFSNNEGSRKRTVKIENINILNSIIEKCKWTNITFRNVKFIASNISETNFVNSKFYSCEFRKSAFFEVDFTGISSSNSEFAQNTIDSHPIGDITVNNTPVNNGRPILTGEAHAAATPARSAASAS